MSSADDAPRAIDRWAFRIGTCAGTAGTGNAAAPAARGGLRPRL